MRRALQRYVTYRPSKQDSLMTKLNFNFAVEWSIVKTEILASKKNGRDVSV